MMKKRLLLAALICGSLVGCGSQQDSGPATDVVASGLPTPPVLPPQLRRSDRWMVDRDGRVVMLHGVNAVWKRAPYFPPDTSEGFTEADADWLRDNGFNTVRLGVLFAGVMPTKGEIDQNYLTQIDRVMQLLASRGIWTQIDFHQDMMNERFQGEGFPDWAVQDDGLVNGISLGFPTNYILPGTSRAFENLFANRDDIWSYYRQAWQAVAAKWRDQPYLMGYDLINEPFGGLGCYIDCSSFESDKLQAFQTYMLQGIREVDPENIVWYEPNVAYSTSVVSNLGTKVPMPDDPNLGFSWHNYCALAALTHGWGWSDLPGCYQAHESVFVQSETVTRRLGAATLLSEFGAADDIPDIKQVTSLADKYLTSWQYWHYKGWNDPTSEDASGLKQSMFHDDANLASAKLEKLEVLSRAYPQVTAGQPLALSFDLGTGVLNYRYRPNQVAHSLPTEIFMPKLHYPRGYVATVVGGKVISEPNARILKIEHTPFAQEVKVYARPAGGSG